MFCDSLGELGRQLGVEPTARHSAELFLLCPTNPVVAVLNTLYPSLVGALAR
jgi:hypothetical protein